MATETTNTDYFSLYKQDVARQLKEYNSEVFALSQLVTHFTNVSQSVEKQAALKVQLESDNEALAYRNRELQDQLVKRGGGGEVMTKDDKERLHQEVLQQFKRRDELANALMEKQREIDRFEKLKQERARAVETAQAREKAKMDDISKLTSALEESDETIDVVKAELNSLQMRLLKKENAMRDMKKDADEIEKKLLERASQEVKFLDDANTKFLEAQKQGNPSSPMSSSGSIGKGNDQASPQHSSGGLNKTRTASKTGPEHKAGQGGKGGKDTEEFTTSVSSFTIPRTSRNQFQVSQSEINALAFSPTGQSFATGGIDKMLRIWDSASGRLKINLTGSEKTIMSIDFAQNDEYIMASSTDTAARVWSISLGRVHHNLMGHRSEVVTSKFSFDTLKITTGSKDRTLRNWDTTRGYCLKTIDCESSPNDLAVARDNYVVVSGHMDNSLRFFDIKNGEKIHSCTQLHGGQITGVAISSDGRKVISNSRDKTMKLLDLRNYKVIHTFQHPNFSTNNNYTRCCFSPDGKYVVSGGSEGAIYIWNVETADVEAVLKNADVHTTHVNCVAWNPNPALSQIASADKSGLVSLWQ